MSGTAPTSDPVLRKELGQHHLLHGELCRPLVAFLRAAEREVLEIGPGGGILTRELLAAGARVLAWELDPAWAFALRARLGRGPALRIVIGDAMEIPWERSPAPCVAGNLPYNVATAILERALQAPAVERVAVLVQLEVGERLVAGPGDREYGASSVLTRAWSTPQWLGRVRRGSFRPPPKVDGAFVGFHTHAPPLPRDEMPRFTRFVRLCFAQRRKTLRNSLASGVGKEAVLAALDAAELPEKTRAETLPLETFVRLYELLRRALAEAAAGNAATRDAPAE